MLAESHLRKDTLKKKKSCTLLSHLTVTVYPLMLAKGGYLMLRAFIIQSLLTLNVNDKNGFQMPEISCPVCDFRFFGYGAV